MQKLRIEVLRFGSGGERSIAVFADVQQSMFTVMLKISEALAAKPIANCKEVIDSLVAQESGNRSIEISAMQDAHHVHNEIIDVDQHILIRNRRIIHTICVLTLKSKVVRIVCQIQRGRQLMQSIESHGISIRCVHRVRAGFRLQHIIIRCRTTKVAGRVLRFGSFLCLVHAPILAVQIQVIPVTASVWLSHRALRFSGEHILNHGVTRIAAETPGIVLSRSQIHLLE